jgi:uncharacterized protein YdaT
MNNNQKKIIRKKAKSILNTYMNDGHVRNKVHPMAFYFKAVKYILTH